jgi:pimeloyl-ACP methyl ester carboxylesterase
MFVAEDRFITLDGHQLRYRVAGSGPPMLLVHGFAGSLYTWRELLPLLAETHCVYALDLLGFGFSDKPVQADHSLRGHGLRLLGFCAALGLSNVTLIGHSMGGVVAAYAALEDRQGVITRLALLDANFYRRNGPPIPVVPPLARLLARRFYSPRAREASLRRCYADPQRLTAEVVESYLAPTRTPGALEALSAFLATPGPATYRELPPRLRLPTLIVWGAQDALWPLADAQRLAAAIPNAQLAIIEGAGHMVQEEQPVVLAERLQVFVRG